MNVERGRESRARRLSEHASDVVKWGNPVEPEVPPTRIDRRPNRAWQVVFVHLVGHVGAVPRHLAPHQWIALGPNRLGVRG